MHRTVLNLSARSSSVMVYQLLSVIAVLAGLCMKLFSGMGMNPVKTFDKAFAEAKRYVGENPNS